LTIHPNLVAMLGVSKTIRPRPSVPSWNVTGRPLPLPYNSQDCTLSIVIRLRSGLSRKRRSNNGRGKRFIFPGALIPVLGAGRDPASCLMLMDGSFPELKRLEREADHSHNLMLGLRMSGCICLFSYTPLLCVQ
jgi:hypothetical protein